LLKWNYLFALLLRKNFMALSYGSCERETPELLNQTI